MMIHPIDKVFYTQMFGERPEVYKQFGLKGHNGIDYRTRFLDSPLGKRYIVAALEGIVREVRWDIKGYGIHVRIDHPDGGLTIYGHLTKPYVEKGQSVKQGERIGLSGNSGFSSAPHLHFEYRPQGWETSKNGYAGAINPLPLLPTI